jgi:flavin-dependent dehydrogenase
MSGWRGDVVVVGAGPAGAWAAAQMARAGLRVALVDRARRGEAGAQWVNGVAGWCFEAAALSPPQAPELLGEGHRFHLLSPSGSARVVVEDNPIFEVDMRALGARVAAAAEAAGAALYWEAQAGALTLDGQGRPRALSVRRSGHEEALEASLFVDASGLGAALRRQLPALARACPKPGVEDLCAAAQEVRAVKDLVAARAFFAAHGAGEGETLAWTGVEGGFSVLNLRLDEAQGEVSILTGAIARPGLRSGQKMLDGFVAEAPWVGERRWGGARAIPLRRPYTHLTAPGLALLGDAACQVYATHGSGIGIGLVAARLLAEAVAEAAARGDDLGAQGSLWAYAARFHRQWMPLLGAADAFRRFSQRLTKPELERLMGGLLTPQMAGDGLAQRPARLDPRELPALLRGLARAPALGLRLAPILARMPLIALVARAWPSQDGPHAQVDLYRYERRLRWLVDMA